MPRGQLSILLQSLCFSALPGFFSHGEWKDLDNCDSPALQDLAKQLPGIALRDRAPSTVRAYTKAFQRWSEWAQSHSLSSLPASSAHLCLYVAFILQTARTAAPLNCFLAAIAWAHEKAGVDDPTQSPMVRQVANGARRILAAPIRKKKPLTSKDIKAIVDHFLSAEVDISDLQVVTLIVLGFASFLRWDELSRLTPDCFQFFPTHLSVFIEQRKNDALREGHWVFVARTHSPTCPVSLLERFLREGSHSDSQPLFCKVGRRKSGVGYLRPARMTYSRARELVSNCFAAIGLQASSYGLHSLRAGGASAAANAGVPDRLFRRHGGWKSESAKDGYLQESLSDLLRVSRSLDLWAAWFSLGQAPASPTMLSKSVAAVTPGHPNQILCPCVCKGQRREIHLFAGRAVKRERRKGSSRRQHTARRRRRRYQRSRTWAAAQRMLAGERENGARRYIQHDRSCTPSVDACLCWWQLPLSPPSHPSPALRPSHGLSVCLSRSLSLSRLYAFKNVIVFNVHNMLPIQGEQWRHPRLSASFMWVFPMTCRFSRVPVGRLVHLI